jgi:hypothetical protein
MTQRPVSLIGFANVLKQELSIGGSMDEIIDQSSIQLGVSDADSLLTRANKCYDLLFGFSDCRDTDPVGAPVSVRSALVGLSEAELVQCRWQAGVSGSGAEGYNSNPWSFSADHRFTVDRDGSSGSWALTQRRHPLTGVPVVKLRLDWEGEKNVNWAEFTMNRPLAGEVEVAGDAAGAADPLFSCTGSSCSRLRKWSMRKTPAPGKCSEPPVGAEEMGSAWLSAAFLDHLLCGESYVCFQTCSAIRVRIQPFLVPFMSVAIVIVLFLCLLLLMFQD